jgi:hypothetical protein
MSTTMRWVGLALLGVAIAVGVSIAASGLVSQQIGLASEPITAGDALAPHAAVGAKRHQESGHKTPSKKTPTPHALPPATTTAPETSEAQPPTTEPEPSLESNPPGGEGDHGGGGGGADD